MKIIKCIMIIAMLLGCSSNGVANDSIISDTGNNDVQNNDNHVNPDINQETSIPSNDEDETDEIEIEESDDELANVFKFNEVEMPVELVSIPDELKVPIEESGTLEYFYYDTKYYDKDNSDMRKYALIYLPYNYDPSKSYDIVYLMHGRDDSPEHFFGTIENPSATKYMLDHLIADGMRPTIVVACDYYPNNKQVFNGDGDASMTKNFGQEFLNDLMPQVESTYSTYAKGTTLEDFEESRMHRVFAGFSMGAVTTWYRMADAMPYCAYYLAMSGTLYWGTEVHTEKKDASSFISNFLDDSIEGLGYTDKDFVMVATVGTKDFALRTMNDNIEHLKKSRLFNFTDSSRFINSYYYIDENQPHDYNAAGDYIYNILPLFMEMVGE